MQAKGNRDATESFEKMIGLLPPKEILAIKETEIKWAPNCVTKNIDTYTSRETKPVFAGRNTRSLKNIENKYLTGFINWSTDYSHL